MYRPASSYSFSLCGSALFVCFLFFVCLLVSRFSNKEQQMWHKVSDFVYKLYMAIFTARYCHRCTALCPFLSYFNQLMLVKMPDIQFYDIAPSGSRVAPFGQTDTSKLPTTSTDNFCSLLCERLNQPLTTTHTFAAKPGTDDSAHLRA